MTETKIAHPPVMSVELVDALPHPMGYEGRTLALREAPSVLLRSDGVRWHEVTRGAEAKTTPLSPEAATVLLELIQQVIATLLYFARAAHDRTPTAPAQVPYAQLPQAWQADFARVAKMAVSSLDAKRQAQAERAARGHAERLLKAEAVLAHSGDVFIATSDLTRFILTLTRTETPNLVSEILAAYQEALCQ